MPMQLHELHPSVVHAPLALLPAAAILDAAAAAAPRGRRRRALDALGRKLWWAGVASAAVAGVAGMAASQEIRLEDERARDAMWLHGVGNVAILLASIGLAAWRSSHRATPATAALGATAVGGALYTAWLGGSLVYTHGAGVKAAQGRARASIGDSPPLLSAAAPWTLLRDAWRGLGWLLGRAGRLGLRRQPLAEGAATRASDAPPRPPTPAEPALELRP